MAFRTLQCADYTECLWIMDIFFSSDDFKLLSDWSSIGPLWSRNESSSPAPRVLCFMADTSKVDFVFSFVRCASLLILIEDSQEVLNFQQPATKFSRPSAQDLMEAIGVHKLGSTNSKGLAQRPQERSNSLAFATRSTFFSSGTNVDGLSMPHNFSFSSHHSVRTKGFPLPTTPFTFR